MKMSKTFAVAVLAALGWNCGRAVAQIVPQLSASMPPEKLIVDGNSVDVRTGSFSLARNHLSIGPSAFGLNLTQYYTLGAGWTDSLAGRLDVHVVSNVGTVSAAWGNRSWSIEGYSGTPRSGDGTTVWGSPYGFGGDVAVSDGTHIEYSDVTLGYYFCADSTCDTHYWPTTVTHPNGLVLTIHYRVHNGLVRVQSVTNNAGYQIKFRYQTDDPAVTGWMTRIKATAINNAVEYCDPVADACTLTGNWPSVTYVNNPASHTVTDALNRSTVHSYGSNYYRIKTPTATTDNIEYTFTSYLETHFGDPGYLVWQTATARKGSDTWNYAFTNQYSAPASRTMTSIDPLGGQTVAKSVPEVISGFLLETVKDPLARIYPVSLCPHGQTSVTFPEGNAYTVACDEYSNVISTTRVPKPGSGLGNIFTTAGFTCAFSNCNKPSYTRDGRGAQTDYTYYPDHDGVKTITEPPVNGVRPQKRYSYSQLHAYAKDSSGTLVPAATPIWVLTQIAECRTSNYSTTTNSCEAGAADEVFTTFEYAGTGAANRMLVRGQVVTTGGDSLRTCFAYDAMGNQISVTSPRAGLSSCSDSAPTGGGTFTTSYRYDAARQLVGTIGPADESGVRQAMRNTYDAEGQVAKVERGYLTAWQSDAINPAAWSSFTAREIMDRTYDTLSRLLTERRSSSTTADRVLTQVSYDAIGRKECVAVRMNPTLYGSAPPYSLPPSACTLGAQGVNGPDRITRFIYDAAGQLLTEQRAYGTPLQQNYANYFYTSNGRQDWVEDANGNRTDFAYDGVDRLLYLFFPSTTVGAHAPNVDDYELYGYDANSNKTSVRLRSGETISYAFDALNRVSFKDLPSPATDVYYGYDLQGHMLYSRFGSAAPAAVGVTNVFDGFGRLTSTTSISPTDTRQLSFRYDPEGNRTQITWPDSNYVQYTYDGLNRIDQVRENGATSGPGLLADYSYDALGRRSGISFGNSSSASYGYDGISRIASVGQSRASAPWSVSYGFSYNEAGQVIQRTLDNDSYTYLSAPESKTYTPDGLNRYASVAGMSFGYDLRGNLTSDGSRSFTYDYENRLLTAAGSSPLSLSYDPMGRLMTTTSGGIATRYLYDGDDLIGEYTNGTLARRYVHGAGADEPLVWYEGTALTDRRWMHANHQGSVITASDASGQATIYSYSAYGEPANDDWSGSRFRYTGQIALPEAKLYHYKARVYDPKLGRFLQTDPVGYADDFNFYAYVSNDPLNRTDPTGRTGEATALGCAITIEIGCAPGAAVGALIDITIIGVGLWAAHEIVKSDDADPAPKDPPRPSDGLPVRDGATVERPGKTGSKDQIYGKTGGVDKANEDFDRSADPDSVVDRGGGVRTGTTPSGDNITVRPDSKSGEPTVEITRGNGRERDTDKFRYRRNEQEDDTP